MSLFKHFTRHTLAVCLFSVAANVIAAPIIFTQSEYTSFASVDMGDKTSGLNSNSSPPDALPLVSSANLADSGNSSSATGSANTGQLDVSTDTLGSSLLAAATSGAGFSGTFTGTGQSVNFVIDYSTSDEVFFGGLAGSQLFVTLLSNGVTLFDGTFSSTQQLNQNFILPSGSNNLFDIQLVSNAVSDGTLGDIAVGSNIASVAFSLNAAPVPEPSMAWLMAGGLGLVVWARRKGGRAAIA